MVSSSLHMGSLQWAFHSPGILWLHVSEHLLATFKQLHMAILHKDAQVFVHFKHNLLDINYSKEKFLTKIEGKNETHILYQMHAFQKLYSFSDN
jgi:hypothetical protein